MVEKREEKFVKLGGKAQSTLNPGWIKQNYPNTYNDIRDLGKRKQMISNEEQFRHIYCKSCNHGFWVYRNHTISSKDHEGVHRCPFCGSEEDMVTDEICGYCKALIPPGKKLFCSDECADKYKGSTHPEEEAFPGSP